MACHFCCLSCYCRTNASITSSGLLVGNNMEHFPLRLCTWGSSWQIFLPCVSGEATFTRNTLQNRIYIQPIYVCQPAMYILSDNFTSEWHAPANSGLSRGPLSQPPFQWRSQRACHTGVSNALKRQRVIDTPCPLARYTIGWCQLEDTILKWCMIWTDWLYMYININ